MTPELPPIPDALPEIPPLPPIPDVLPGFCDLLNQSERHKAELLRLKERIATLESHHRVALREYREDRDRLCERIVRAVQDATRARNEADALARALRELVETCECLTDTSVTMSERLRARTALTQAREVLILWGQK